MWCIIPLLIVGAVIVKAMYWDSMTSQQRLANIITWPIVLIIIGLLIHFG